MAFTVIKKARTLEDSERYWSGIGKKRSIKAVA